ncbi:MAG: bifunctional demethylmenaquinone methyltransferase/2-methoxy-6-polyprenyl-1,4-benzoquinol methylase UbiE [Acidobacteriota bacterium]
MTNKYLSYDEKRAPRVREMFSRLAWRYDLVNDVMSFGMHRAWKRRTVRLGFEGLAGARRWLDLCCGTGDMAFLAEQMAGRYDPGLRVFGLDFTLPMLAVAARRKTRDARKTAFAQGDALRLPFPDGAFDVITVGYGLRNIAEPEAALVEMRRVLAPGGRCVILDFGKPQNRVASVLYKAFLRTMMPTVGWLFHRDPETYLYIPESLARYPGQVGVRALMEKAGFQNSRFEEKLLGTMGINLGER